MSQIPPGPGESDEADTLYRRASALDAGRPSGSVRRAVLDHAAQLAANRAAGQGPARSGAGRPVKRQMWWRPAAFGTLAAAVLAGILVIPQYLPRAPVNPTSSVLPAPAPTPASAPAPTPAPTPAPVPPPAAFTQPQAAQAPSPQVWQETEARTADRKGAPTAGSATENAVVTAAKKMPAEGRSRQTAQDAIREPSMAGEPVAPAAQSAQSAPSASSAPSAQDSAQPAARSARSVAASPAPLSYALRPQASLASSAARLEDPAVQLRQAAERGDVPALQALLGNHPVIDARDALGRTALMLATLHGRTQAALMLLSAGADPNAPDANGTMPLQAALAANQPAIVAALRQAGAR